MKRRFIAGVKCPTCEQMDKIQMFDDEHNVRWRECVSCGFKEKLHDQPEQELPTRVNQNKLGEKPLAHETEVEVVQLIDPKNLH